MAEHRGPAMNMVLTCAHRSPGPRADIPRLVPRLVQQSHENSDDADNHPDKADRYSGNGGPKASSECTDRFPAPEPFSAGPARVATEGQIAAAVGGSYALD